MPFCFDLPGHHSSNRGDVCDLGSKDATQVGGRGIHGVNSLTAIPRPDPMFHRSPSPADRKRPAGKAGYSVSGRSSPQALLSLGYASRGIETPSGIASIQGTLRVLSVFRAEGVRPEDILGDGVGGSSWTWAGNDVEACMLPPPPPPDFPPLDSPHFGAPSCQGRPEGENLPPKPKGLMIVLGPLGEDGADTPCQPFGASFMQLYLPHPHHPSPPGGLP